jgi:hypothetical protein
MFVLFLLCYLVDEGDVFDVSKVHAASIHPASIHPEHEDGIAQVNTMSQPMSKGNIESLC